MDPRFYMRMFLLYITQGSRAYSAAMDTCHDQIKTKVALLLDVAFEIVSDTYLNAILHRPKSSLAFHARGTKDLAIDARRRRGGYVCFRTCHALKQYWCTIYLKLRVNLHYRIPRLGLDSRLRLDGWLRMRGLILGIVHLDVQFSFLMGLSRGWWDAEFIMEALKDIAKVVIKRRVLGILEGGCLEAPQRRDETDPRLTMRPLKTLPKVRSSGSWSWIMGIMEVREVCAGAVVEVAAESGSGFEAELGAVAAVAAGLPAGLLAVPVVESDA
ncbi:hypothetical protein FBULB1_329 [Fusarium bulbicola]|nr:hypothetical protein FBULB1_329 [Fusarium bulbicola]